MVTNTLSFWVSLKRRNRTATVFAAPSGGKAGSVLSLPQINYLLKSQQQLVCWFEFYLAFKHKNKRRLKKAKSSNGEIKVWFSSLGTGSLSNTPTQTYIAMIESPLLSGRFDYFPNTRRKHHSSKTCLPDYTWGFHITIHLG